MNSRHSRPHRASLLNPARGALGVAALLATTSAGAQERRGVTRGHVAVGFALFDRVGTLAAEGDARGFAPVGGPTVTLGFDHTLAAVPWLAFGGGLRGTFGSSSQGEHAYFFNPIFTYATAIAYVPLGPRGSALDVGVELGMTNILARNEDPGVGGPRTRPEFGIGLGAGAGVGYRLALNSLGVAPTIRLTHTRHWTSIPVSEAPNKSWNFGSTSLVVGLEW